MDKECDFCSALGLYCVSVPNRTGREARVAEIDQPFIRVEEPISACRVLPHGHMSGSETDQTPNWDGLSVFIMALFNAGLLKDKEIKRIQERAGGALYGRAVKDAIVYAVNQILERAEFNQNGATEHTSARSLESIESALRHPDLTWLIDPRYEIVVSKKYTQGVVFVGELIASLSEEIKQRLPDSPDTLLHILVKSNQKRVNLDLKELAAKCAFTKNSHLLDRDPRKRPFCIWLG